MPDADKTAPPPLSAPARSFAKRAFDLALSSLMLAASAPVWAAVMLAILLTDGRPVFFAQERWGLHGRRFRVLKFRSMYKDSVHRFGVRLSPGQHDPRITPVGRLLRATGLDELPNLLSIWKGEMSFVGPRALAVDEVVSEIDPRYRSYEEVPGFHERLTVRPGLTGLATVHLPRTAGPRRKFAVDVLYVRRWSFRLDLRLVALSFYISFRGRWETKEKKIKSFPRI